MLKLDTIAKYKTQCKPTHVCDDRVYFSTLYTRDLWKQGSKESQKPSQRVKGSTHPSTSVTEHEETEAQYWLVP